MEFSFCLDGWVSRVSDWEGVGMGIEFLFVGCWIVYIYMCVLIKFSEEIFTRKL